MRNAQTFLRMETPPLRLGDVLFADGNAAARTFGRAHRRRPYYFSYGSCYKVAGEVLAADYLCGLSQERGSSSEMTARYGGRQAFAGEMMVLQNDVRLPVSRPLRKK